MTPHEKTRRRNPPSPQHRSREPSIGGQKEWHALFQVADFLSRLKRCAWRQMAWRFAAKRGKSLVLGRPRRLPRRPRMASRWLPMSQGGVTPTRFAMSMRHSWKGFLKLSLVTVPVKAYPVSASDADIHLNQLHGCCKSRIKYKKTCPLHGEVASGDIVSGYEFATDQYVVVDPDELDRLRTESDKAIQIDAFIRTGTLDAIYASGKSYYLVADGPVAHQGYAVLWRGMVEEKRQAIAQVVMHAKEQIVWLRPLAGLIVMTQLSYDGQITKPAALADEVSKTAVVPEEMQLLRTLMATCTPEK